MFGSWVGWPRLPENEPYAWSNNKFSAVDCRLCSTVSFVCELYACRLLKCFPIPRPLFLSDSSMGWVPSPLPYGQLHLMLQRLRRACVSVHCGVLLVAITHYAVRLFSTSLTTRTRCVLRWCCVAQTVARCHSVPTCYHAVTWELPMCCLSLLMGVERSRPGLTCSYSCAGLAWVRVCERNTSWAYGGVVVRVDATSS